MIHKILGDPTPFLDHIFIQLKNIGIQVDQFELDHICYRVESLERYKAIKWALGKIAELITESMISNRPIAIYKLDHPIIYKSRSIYLLELPAPKTGSFYEEGFEHVEFVIDQSLAEFKQTYSQIDFDEKGMKKEINPDLRIGFPTNSVKFHLYNLEYVIRYLDQQ